MISAVVNPKRRAFQDHDDPVEEPQTFKRSKPTADESTEPIDIETNGDGSVVIGYRPPVIQLNALQRLSLLKKRREKWRISTLYNLKNFHARGSHRPHTNSDSKSLTKYVEQSTQTDNVPDLVSKTAVTKSNAKDEAEKKLKQGVFSGLLFYDASEIEDNENKSPVKFSTKTKKNDFIESVSNNQLGSLLNDTGKLIQSEAAPKLLPLQPISLSKDTSNVLSTKPTSSSLLKSTVKPQEIQDQDEGLKPKAFGPSAGFNFLKTNKVEKVTTSNDDKDDDDDDDDERSRKKRTKGSDLAFGSTVQTSTPAFSLNSSKDKKDSLFGSTSNTLFGKKEEAFKLNDSASSETAAAKPSFNFGGLSSEKKTDAPTANLFGSSITTEKKDDKPAFSFNKDVSKPAFSLGGTLATTEKKDEPSKPTFSFGSTAPSLKKTEVPVSTSTFSFGSSTPSEKKSELSAVSFGAATAKNDDLSKPTLAFNFGTTAAPSTETTDEKKRSESAVLGFGSSITEKKDEAPASKPSFSLGNNKFSFSSGASDNPTDKPKPASTFDFGKSTLPSEFSLGAANPVASSTSAFGASSSNLFGSKSEENKPSTSVLGGASTLLSGDKPASSFNFVPATAASTTSDASKPSFVFGASSSDKDTTTKPAFSFGETKLPTAPTTTLDKPNGFGSTSSTASPAPFSFNAISNTSQSDNKPIFNFGGSTTTQNPASVFGANSQSQPPTTSAFGFTSTPSSAGSSSTALAPFGQPTQPATSGFNFGASNANTQAPAFGSNSTSTFGSQSTSAAPAFVGTQNSFNFGGAATTADPSKIFGQVPAFGGPANPSSAPGTPSQTANRTQGRKIAQMRARRR